MLALKIAPLVSNHLDRPFVQEKKGSLRNLAAGGGLHPAFGGTAYHQTLADILGFFIMKNFLNITLFLLHKRPNIFNVLTMASA